MSDEQVERTVAVVVHERGARAPARARDAGLRRDVDETAVAVVSQQHVVAEIRHVQIGEAIVVEVAGRHAHPVTAGAGAARNGHVFERAVTAVVIQPVAAGRIGRRTADIVALERQSAALHEIQIQEAVVVHVEEGDAAAHDFRQQVLGLVARRVDEADAGARSDLFEPRSAAWWRGSRFITASAAHRAAGDERKGKRRDDSAGPHRGRGVTERPAAV